MNSMEQFNKQALNIAEARRVGNEAEAVKLEAQLSWYPQVPDLPVALAAGAARVRLPAGHAAPVCSTTRSPRARHGSSARLPVQAPTPRPGHP